MIVIKTNQRTLKIKESQIKLTARSGKGIPLSNLLKLKKGEVIENIRCE